MMARIGVVIPKFWLMKVTNIGKAISFRTPYVDGLSPFMVKLAMVNTIALRTLPSGYD